MNTETIRRHAEHCFAQANAATGVVRVRFIRAAKAWESLGRTKNEADFSLLSDKMPIQTQQQAA
jgi:hypothetical protein